MCYPSCSGTRRIDEKTGEAMMTFKELEEENFRQWKERVDDERA